mmetsp:Transcript_15725/g.50414  ORF Transcript_15725/g.50414 Transcript_15725/m.50414 type:complete len:599 (-) Transcript_15725:727-2523(-)
MGHRRRRRAASVHAAQRRRGWADVPRGQRAHPHARHGAPLAPRRLRHVLPARLLELDRAQPHHTRASRVSARSAGTPHRRLAAASCHHATATATPTASPHLEPSTLALRPQVCRRLDHKGVPAGPLDQAAQLDGAPPCRHVRHALPHRLRAAGRPRRRARQRPSQAPRVPCSQQRRRRCGRSLARSRRRRGGRRAGGGRAGGAVDSRVHRDAGDARRRDRAVVGVAARLPAAQVGAAGLRRTAQQRTQIAAAARRGRRRRERRQREWRWQERRWRGERRRRRVGRAGGAAAGGAAAARGGAGRGRARWTWTRRRGACCEDGRRRPARDALGIRAPLPAAVEGRGGRQRGAGGGRRAAQAAGGGRGRRAARDVFVHGQRSLHARRAGRACGACAVGRLLGRGGRNRADRRAVRAGDAGRLALRAAPRREPALPGGDAAPAQVGVGGSSAAQAARRDRGLRVAGWRRRRRRRGGRRGRGGGLPIQRGVRLPRQLALWVGAARARGKGAARRGRADGADAAAAVHCTGRARCARRRRVAAGGGPAAADAAGVAHPHARRVQREASRVLRAVRRRPAVRDGRAAQRAACAARLPGLDGPRVL